MPEGDTVWTTADLLARSIGGAVVRDSDFRVPSLSTVDLSGWTVAGSASRGKHLLLRLASPDGSRRLTLHSHLRMDGRWRVFGPGRPWRGGPGHTIRVVLRTARGDAVGYHLHDVALVPTSAEDRLVGHLGPDPLGDDWDPDEAVRRLRAAPDLPIGAALLDQRRLAGIGNLYKSETLFLRGVSPWLPVSAVPDLPGLVGRARELLLANRGRWTQATTGSLRPDQRTYVFDRAGLPCRRCGTTIRRDRQGERITYWCPSCQPGPAPTGSVRPGHARP